MPLELEYRDGAGYLTVEVSGRWEEEEAKQAIGAIRDEANRRKQTRLFLDMRGLAPPTSDMTRYFTGEHIAKHWGHPFRTAALWRQESYSGLAETAALNRGASILVFFEKEAALEWLLKGANKMDAGDGSANRG
jgi:hypothetical protein